MKEINIKVADDSHLFAVAIAARSVATGELACLAASCLAHSVEEAIALQWQGDRMTKLFPISEWESHTVAAVLFFGS